MNYLQHLYFKCLFPLILMIFASVSAEQCCWRGVYLSGQLGEGWNSTHTKFANANFFNTLGPVVLGSKFDFSSHGFIGGGALGYNYQRDCFVVGLEGGALRINLKDSRPSPFFPVTDTFTSNLEWLANAKLRVGYTQRCVLVFLTGGWAGGNVSVHLNDPSTSTFASSKKWANGWTVGAGADYRISRCFSLGLAYDYYKIQYHNANASCATCGSGVGFGSPKLNNNIQTQTLTLRLNYIYSL